MNGCVLVVDDQSAQRLVSTTVLEPLAQAGGFRVLDAADGEGALEVLRDLADDGTSVLVLSDALMPGMGGLELVRTARADLPDLDARFVLFTAHDAGRYQDAERELDLAAVVTKPIGIEDLRSVLQEQVTAWQDGAARVSGRML